MKTIERLIYNGTKPVQVGECWEYYTRDGAHVVTCKKPNSPQWQDFMVFHPFWSWTQWGRKVAVNLVYGEYPPKKEDLPKWAQEKKRQP